MPRGGKRPGAGRPKGSAKIKRGVTYTPDPIEYQIVESLAQKGAADAMKTIVWLSRNADTHACRLNASIAVIDRAWGKPKQSYQHRHQHKLEPQDRPVTDVEFVGQVDLRRLNDEELRDFRRLLDRATIPPAIEAEPIRAPGSDRE